MVFANETALKTVLLRKIFTRKDGEVASSHASILQNVQAPYIDGSVSLAEDGATRVRQQLLSCLLLSTLSRSSISVLLMTIPHIFGLTFALFSSFSVSVFSTFGNVHLICAHLLDSV